MSIYLIIILFQKNQKKSIWHHFNKNRVEIITLIYLLFFYYFGYPFNIRICELVQDIAHSG